MKITGTGQESYLSRSRDDAYRVTAAGSHVVLSLLLSEVCCNESPELLPS